MSDLPWKRYVFSGTAEQVGCQLGECFRSSLQELIELRYEAFSEYMKMPVASLKSQFKHHVTRQEQLLKTSDALAHQEMSSICRAASVTMFDHLLTANMTDYRDHGDAEGCTSMVGRLDSGELYGAQTWDLGVENMKHVVLVDRSITNRPRVVALSCAGYPPLTGMNEHGLGLGTTNIKTSEVGLGLGYQSLLQLGLWQRNVDEAKRSFQSHERCGSHTYWLVDELAACQLDTTHRQCCVESLRDHPYHPLVRVNHPIPESLKSVQLEEPSETSLARLRRAELSLTHVEGPQALKDVMGNREDGVHSISRHIEDGTGITTNGCVLLMPNQKKIWACRGPADIGDWISFEFDHRQPEGECHESST
jgi:hypothetical protein